MTNKCPFCGTPATEHKVGRCLDHWIETIKKGYKYELTKEQNRCFDIDGEPYRHPESEHILLTIDGKPSASDFGKGLDFFDIADDTCAIHIAPKYSKDLNAAITLLPNRYFLFNYDRKWHVTAVCNFIDLHEGLVYGLTNDGLSNPALAICRAYLITNLEG